MKEENRKQLLLVTTWYLIPEDYTLHNSYENLISDIEFLS
jgi:hypothetical protein